MQRDVMGPTGLARRGRRLSDGETERRMIRSAVGMVNRAGLTVSLDHISFEDVIRDADVARSAVYRRWPYKDLFFSDLIKALAADATPDLADEEVELMQTVIAAHDDWLDSAQGRHDLVLELFRQLAVLDFDTIRDSAAWRTYLALQATFNSLGDGELRDQVQQALAQSERRRSERIAQAWEQLSALFGYRLRPELAGFDTLATLLNATLRGLVIMTQTAPDIAGQTVHGRLFDATTARDWSLAALGLTAIANAFLEPDPTIAWDPARVAYVRQTLAEWTAPPG
jgi:AcrR family transcriptional regulator